MLFLCFWIVLEKTVESPLHSKEIKPVNPKGNQPWIFIGRTDAEGKAPIGHLITKSQLIGKDPDTGKDQGQEKKGVTEDEMVDGIANSMDMSLSNLRELVTEQLNSVVQLCDPMDCSTPGLPVHYQLLELTQTHVHWVGYTIQPFSSVVPFSSCL